MTKWEIEMENNKKPFDFIELEFVVDMREAEKRYKDEYRNDVGNIKTNRLTFSQWTQYKKYKAAKFYTEYSEFNTGF